MSPSILGMAFYMILRKEPYREAGTDHLDKHKSEATEQRLIKPREAIGYPITIQQQLIGATA